MALAALAVLGLVAEPSSPSAQGWFGQEQRGVSRRSTDHAAADAARMLSIARDYLDQGEVGLARGQLEILLQRHPDRDEAQEARRLIARLSERDLGLRAVGSAAPPAPAAPSASAPGPTPALRPVEARRQQAMDEELRTAAGDRVFFAEASADLGTNARTALGAQAKWLNRHKELLVVVEAHADDRGDRAFNAEMARQRAEAVRRRLVEEGVDASRIRTLVYGKDHPLAICTHAECAAQNRRVVTRVEDGRSRAGRLAPIDALPAGFGGRAR